MSQPLHLLTFLGTGNYQPGRYHLPGTNCVSGPERFVQAALIDLLRQQGRAVGRVTVLLTASAEARHWADHDGLSGLRTALEARRSTAPFEFVALTGCPDGATESELWELFDRITSAVGADDRLVVDITHGFRSLPMLLTIALDFVTKVRGARLDSLLYGSWEARQGDLAPVFDLSPLRSLLDWTAGLQTLLSSGHAGLLGQQMQALPAARRYETLRHYGAALDALADAVNCAAARAIAARGGELRAAHAAMLAELPAADPALRPVREVLEAITQRYGNLAGPEPAEDVSAHLRAQLQAAEMLLDHQQYMQAFTLLREGLDTLANHYYPEVERRVVGRFVKGLGRRGLDGDRAQQVSRLFEAVKDERNRLDHGFTGDGAEFTDSSELLASGRALLEDFRSLLVDALPPPTQPLGGRAVALLRAPLTDEQTQAVCAQLGVAGLASLPASRQTWLTDGPGTAPLRTPSGQYSTTVNRLLDAVSKLVDAGDLALVDADPRVSLILVDRLRQKGIESYYPLRAEDGSITCVPYE